VNYLYFTYLQKKVIRDISCITIITLMTNSNHIFLSYILCFVVKNYIKIKKCFEEVISFTAIINFHTTEVHNKHVFVLSSYLILKYCQFPISHEQWSSVNWLIRLNKTCSSFILLNINIVFFSSCKYCSTCTFLAFITKINTFDFVTLINKTLYVTDSSKVISKKSSNKSCGQ
jgi:hypothetical protein